MMITLFIRDPHFSSILQTFKRVVCFFCPKAMEHEKSAFFKQAGISELFTEYSNNGMI